MGLETYLKEWGPPPWGSQDRGPPHIWYSSLLSGMRSKKSLFLGFIIWPVGCRTFKRITSLGFSWDGYPINQVLTEIKTCKQVIANISLTSLWNSFDNFKNYEASNQITSRNNKKGWAWLFSKFHVDHLNQGHRFLLDIPWLFRLYRGCIQRSDRKHFSLEFLAHHLG